MDKNTKRYQYLFKLYSLAHPNKSSRSCQAEVNEIWNSKLKDDKKKIDDAAYDAEVEKLKVKKKVAEVGIRSFFKNSEKQRSEVVGNEVQSDEAVGDATTSTVVDEALENVEPLELTKPERHPAQDKLQEELRNVEKILANLIETRSLGLGADSSASLLKQIKEAKNLKDSIEKRLRRKIIDQKASQKQRDRKRENEVKIREKYPEIAASLKIRDSVGRPRIECDQPGILEDMLQMAMIGSACGEKRRDDIFRSVKTVDDLHQELNKMGYKISRSAVYLRLLPRDQTSNEGKKHVKTVPVKLIRPQNDLRKGHPDRMFAAESFKAVDNIANFLGPEAALYISQDDKSSVPLGVIAAKKQSSILMSVRTRVRLPDHDFKVGSKHLLVPSVIAVCQIDPKVGVTYSGPTYIGVRSAKHNGSTAFSHAEDLTRLCDLEPEIFKLSGSVREYKPVIVKGVDGGPDENPRFHNNIVMGCKTFQHFNLDCYIEVTNAPGLSAYNRAERRMYHLSKELTGVVLPYDTYGSHLVNGKTVDEELEVKNFQAAGEVLAEIWSNLEIDNHKVHAEFVSKSVDEETKKFQASPEFRARHVLETQYMTVYLKCDDKSCCSAPRTKVELLFPNRRIPTLIPIKLTATGPVAMELVKDINKKDISFPDIFARVVVEKQLMPESLTEKFGDVVPYDVYFPTQQDKVIKRICKNCSKYHASIKSLALHKKVCKKKRVNSKKGGKKSTKKSRREIVVSDEDPDENGEVSSGEEDLEEVMDDDVDASFEDYVNNMDDENIEEVQVEPSVSVSMGGVFEKILNLKEWLKLPWSPSHSE